jgi:hypothetical protein
MTSSKPTAYVRSFECPIDECETGPLKTSEIQHQYLWWTLRAQQDAMTSDEFDNVRVELNLQSNPEGILECRGRINGDYPVFLPQITRLPAS